MPDFWGCTFWDRDPATNIATGINYLDLVATRHRESLTPAPISFTDLAQPQSTDQSQADTKCEWTD